MSERRNDLARGADRGPRAGQRSEGFAGNLGDPIASLGPNAGKDEPAEQHPGLEAVGLPAFRSETARPTQGIAPQGDEPSGGRSAGGVLSAS